MKNIFVILGILIIIVLGGFFLLKSQGEKQLQPEVPEKEAKTMAGEKSELKLTSSAFVDGATIPDKYTCSGEDVNPPLSISGVPENTQSLVLTVDDPDAPGGLWDHWILFNIDPTVTEIEENSVPSSALLGTTSFGNRKYGGPCPPPGIPHHYNIKLYVLDIILSLNAGASKTEVEQAMESHILAQTKLTGLYGR